MMLLNIIILRLKEVFDNTMFSNRPEQYRYKITQLRLGQISRTDSFVLELIMCGPQPALCNYYERDLKIFFFVISRELGDRENI